MNVPIMGIVENMSTFVCPHCGKPIDIFKGNGVKKAAKDFNVDILGKIPIDTKIMESGDSGISYVENNEKSPAADEMKGIVTKIINKLEK